MSLGTILSTVGNDLKKFFGVAVTVATDVAPVIDVLFPGIAPLYNVVVTEVGKAETVAIAAGSQNGTGTQKLALVLQATEAQFVQAAQQNGWNVPDQTQMITYINAVVASLNAFTKTPAAPAS